VLDGVESSRWTILLSITSVDNLIWGGEDWRLMEMRDKCDSVVFMYDGDCGFCSKSVNFLLDNSDAESMKFCALQSEFSAEVFREHGMEANLTSSYLLKNGKLHADSSAVLHAAALCRYPVRALSVFLIVPPFLRNFIYRSIAKNRHSISKCIADRCRIPTESEKKRFIT
jgi:predicted DCC family thiol-disulfide oxidoreductase YuxK